MDKEKLRLAVEFAKEQGLTSIEVDGIKIDLLQTIPKPQEYPDIDIHKLISDISQEYSDEEILYLATPYYDELQEKKKQHQESLKVHEDLNGKD